MGRPRFKGPSELPYEVGRCVFSSQNLGSDVSCQHQRECFIAMSFVEELLLLYLRSNVIMIDDDCRAASFLGRAQTA